MHQTGFPGTSPWAWRTVSALSTFGSTTASIGVVRIVPETNRANDNAPSHRVYVGRAEIGAAWSKRSTEGRDYLSVKLDDPSFNAPIYANLFDDEDGDGHTLIWSRASIESHREKPRPRCRMPESRVRHDLPLGPRREIMPTRPSIAVQLPAPLSEVPP
jgi:uncharacterized protein (DUF736 family)